MSTLRWIFVLGLAVLGAALAVAAAATAATGPFTPTTLAGTWTGTWTNLTFNTSGPASIVASAPSDGRFLFTVDFGGKVFGCSDPPPSSDGMPKGTGPNTWDDTGFRVSYSSDAFGTTNLVYDHAAGKLDGSGTNPTCLNGLKWSITGTFTGETYGGSISIILPDGTPATSKLEMTRTSKPPTPTPTPTPSDDTTAPTVVTRGYIGSRASVPLRWRAKDASGKASFEVTVTPQAKGTPKAVFTKKLAGQVVDAAKLTPFTVSWPAGSVTGTWFKLCVRATDAKRNASAPVCSTIKLTS